MGYMIEIEKADVMEMSEHLGKALRHAGKAMDIAEGMCESLKGYRGYKTSGGYRDEEDEDMYDDYGYPMKGMRRGMRRR